MDCSIYSNSNATGVCDDTLGDRTALKRQLDEVSARLEATQQELHDAKRSYHTALDIQQHLTAELEATQAESARARADLEARLQSARDELDALRAESATTADAHAAQTEAFRSQLDALKARLERERTQAEEHKSRKSDSPVEEAPAEERAEAAARVELEETRAQAEAWRARAAELEVTVEELREAVLLRGQDARGAAEREAAALAELALVRANTELATDTPLSHAAKGNSLFAEVDDKRQELARALLNAKQANAQLRREAAARQRELEALQCERRAARDNTAHQYARLSEMYEERITQLEAAAQRARLEPPWQHARDDRHHLKAIVTHLWERCERLEREATSAGVAELASARQLRDLRQRLALPASAPAPASADTNTNT